MQDISSTLGNDMGGTEVAKGSSWPAAYKLQALICRPMIKNYVASSQL